MKKECSDFTNTTCEKYVPNNSNKKCAVINDKCEEQFKTCELYDKESTKTKEICESILPYKTDSNTLDVYYLEWKWFSSDNDTEIGQTPNAGYQLKIDVKAESI